jgi:hypothetical protein
MLASTGGTGKDSTERFFGFGVLCLACLMTVVFDVGASMKGGGKSLTGGSFCADAATFLPMLELFELLESEDDPEEDEDASGEVRFFLLAFVCCRSFLMVLFSSLLSWACCVAHELILNRFSTFSTHFPSLSRRCQRQTFLLMAVRISSARLPHSSSLLFEKLNALVILPNEERDSTCSFNEATGQLLTCCSKLMQLKGKQLIDPRELRGAPGGLAFF